MTEIITCLAENIVQLFIAGGGTFILIKVIPWIKQLGIYSIVKMCVNAAEKMADSCQITKEEKKDYVIKILEHFGIEVSPIVEAMIEAAVEELDLQKDKIFNAMK